MLFVSLQDIFHMIANDICDYVSDASLTISCPRLIDCGQKRKSAEPIKGVMPQVFCCVFAKTVQNL